MLPKLSSLVLICLVAQLAARSISADVQDCRVLPQAPKYDKNALDKAPIVTSPDNKIALQIVGHIMYKQEHLNDSATDKYIPITGIGEITTEKNYFEIINLKTLCADIDLYISNSSVFNTLSLVSLDIVKLKANIKFEGRRQKGDCNFMMSKDVRRSRFPQAFECARNIELTCPAVVADESSPQLGSLHLRGLKIEFNRPKGARRSSFASEPKQFRQCKDKATVVEEEAEAEAAAQPSSPTQWSLRSPSASPSASPSPSQSVSESVSHSVSQSQSQSQSPSSPQSPSALSPLASWFSWSSTPRGGAYERRRQEAAAAAAEAAAAAARAQHRHQKRPSSSGRDSDESEDDK